MYKRYINSIVIIIIIIIIINNSENRSSGLKTGQLKIFAIADDELHILILNWSKEPIILPILV